MRYNLRRISVMGLFTSSIHFLNNSEALNLGNESDDMSCRISSSASKNTVL